MFICTERVFLLLGKVGELTDRVFTEENTGKTENERSREDVLLICFEDVDDGSGFAGAGKTFNYSYLYTRQRSDFQMTSDLRGGRSFKINKARLESNAHFSTFISVPESFGTFAAWSERFPLKGWKLVKKFWEREVVISFEKASTPDMNGRGRVEIKSQFRQDGIMSLKRGEVASAFSVGYVLEQNGAGGIAGWTPSDNDRSRGVAKRVVEIDRNAENQTENVGVPSGETFASVSGFIETGREMAGELLPKSLSLYSGGEFKSTQKAVSGGGRVRKESLMTIGGH
jgi:hypothetical protein